LSLAGGLRITVKDDFDKAHQFLMLMREPAVRRIFKITLEERLKDFIFVSPRTGNVVSQDLGYRLPTSRVPVGGWDGLIDALADSYEECGLAYTESGDNY
tara:strand:- start:269 stop:568 length:300 start_codon:yes stop_codon:yes gene_type:complete